MDETNEGLTIPDDVQKQLLMDETDKEIHTRRCTKQLLMDETNEGLLITDHVQTTVDG